MDYINNIIFSFHFLFLVNLDCKPESMHLHLNFSEPFRGVISVGKQPFTSSISALSLDDNHNQCAIRGSISSSYGLHHKYKNKDLQGHNNNNRSFTNNDDNYRLNYRLVIPHHKCDTIFDVI